jgi:hypothetical protein
MWCADNCRRGRRAHWVVRNDRADACPDRVDAVFGPHRSDLAAPGRSRSTDDAPWAADVDVRIASGITPDQHVLYRRRDCGATERRRTRSAAKTSPRACEVTAVRRLLPERLVARAVSSCGTRNAESGALTPASIRPPDPLAIAVTGNGRAPVSRGRAPATIAKRRQSFGRRPPIAAKLEGWSRHPRAAAAHSGTITTDVLPTTTGR